MICCQPCNERETKISWFFIYEDKNVEEYVLFANKDDCRWRFDFYGKRSNLGTANTCYCASIPLVMHLVRPKRST